MEKQYRSELERIALAAEEKQALTAHLAARTAHKTRACRPGRLFRIPAVAVAVVCALVLGVGAAVVGVPVLRDYYGGSPGYEQSAVELGESVTQNGWTMTLTDCVADDYNVYAGITLTAPEGTVLDWDEGYHFDKWGSVKFPGLNLGGSGGYDQVEDGDPEDNQLSFILRSSYILEEGQRLDGQSMEITFGGLYHNIGWNEEEMAWERQYDCEETWSFCTTLSSSDHVIRLEPHLEVTTLGVEAVLTRVEISPIGVYVYIEGDALKGHHSWVPRNAPDGWYGCVEYQDITLYTVDGTAIPMTEGLAGSGCSGGSDPTEEGYLHLFRRFGTLMDVDTLDRIEICGVSLLLQP